jgi:hypothetical protein
MLCSVVLWFLPVSESIYAWKTNPRTDTFTVVTAGGVTSDNIILVKSLYDDDVSTITFASAIAEVPSYSSYNTTTRQLTVNSLTAGESRSLDVNYDVTAFEESPTLDTIGEVALWLTYILYVLFPLAGVIYIFWEKWFA